MGRVRVKSLETLNKFRTEKDKFVCDCVLLCPHVWFTLTRCWQQSRSRLHVWSLLRHRLMKRLRVASWASSSTQTTQPVTADTHLRRSPPWASPAHSHTLTTPASAVQFEMYPHQWSSLWCTFSPLPSRPLFSHWVTLLLHAPFFDRSVFISDSRVCLRCACTDCLSSLSLSDYIRYNMPRSITVIDRQSSRLGTEWLMMCLHKCLGV